MKIKHFVYHAGRGRIPCAFQLVKRNWKGGDDKCKMCSESETIKHVLLYYPIAKFAWCVVKEVLNFPVIPISYFFLRRFGSAKTEVEGGGELGVVVFASWIWGIWLTRNDWVFDNKLRKSPLHVFYMIISLLQRWRPIQRKKKEEDHLEQLINDLMTKLQQLRPTGRLPDVLDAG